MLRREGLFEKTELHPHVGLGTGAIIARARRVACAYAPSWLLLAALLGCVELPPPARTDDAGTPPPGVSCPSTSPCWGACDAHYSTCASECGVGDGLSCWDRCTAPYPTCASECGAGTACTAVRCWEACDAHFATCANACGVSPALCEECAPARSANELCWEACDAALPTCVNTCGAEASD